MNRTSLTPDSRIVRDPLVSSCSEGVQGADIWSIVEPVLGNYHQIYVILILAHWKERLVGERVPLQCVQHDFPPRAVFHDLYGLASVYRYSRGCTHIIWITTFEQRKLVVFGGGAKVR